MNSAIIALCPCFMLDTTDGEMLAIISTCRSYEEHTNCEPQSQQVSGPPYPPTTASLGGVPNTDVDAPITSVFLVLYIIAAAAYMAILQLNLKKSHKFLASGALFGFCMARITTCTMRLVWSTHQDSVPIAIAANVFVNAGVIIIIIINLLFAQRILRASHPCVGWHKITHYLFLAYYVSIILLLAALITVIVQQAYTLDANIHRIDRDIQLVGGTYNAVAAFMPVPILIIGVVLPKLRNAHRHHEKFGTGRFRTKIGILLASTLLITLGAGFRVGVSYAPRPINDPAWYHSKTCFYCFTFVTEILVLYMYLFVRVDRRFHIPDGASGRRHYGPAKGKVERRIETEEEFFDDFRPRPLEERKDEENGNSAASSIEPGSPENWEKRAEAELENGIQEPPAVRVR